MKTPWLSERDLQQPGMRLFCLPHAGSGSAAFYQWKRLSTTTKLAFCPVLLPGREARLTEPCITTVRSMVEQLHEAAKPWLQEPYAIFGHSMGSLLAYEWARRIQQEGLPEPHVLFVSGRNAPQLGPGHTQLHRMTDAELLPALTARYGDTQSAVLQDEELRALFLPILRADLEVVESYTTDGLPKLTAPVLALAGTNDTSVSEAGLTAWQQVSSGRFAWLRLPGDHFYHQAEGRDALLQTLAAHLAP